MPRAPAAPAPGRTKQTCQCRERKCSAAKPNQYADEHDTGERGNGR